jgi:putative DNA primase/helicase
VATHLGSSRVGDQIGTLLAGAYALGKNGIVSPETALEWVRGKDWGDATSADADPDERRLLNYLMQQQLRYGTGGNAADRSIGEIIAMALVESEKRERPAIMPRSGWENPEKYRNHDPEDLLKRNGILFVPENLKEDVGAGIWISNGHKALKEMLVGTPWSSKWERALRRLPGTRARQRTEAAISFTGSRDRATFVPIELVT